MVSNNQPRENLSPSWRLISVPQEAKSLVESIADGNSLIPWVVVTTPNGARFPRFDMDQLADQLEGVANLALVTNAEASRAMSSHLRENEDVFSGAARVYPAGYTPDNPLKPTDHRVVHPNQNPAVPTRRLISDALSLAHDAGVFDHTTSAQRLVTGVVTGFVGDDRAFVTIQGTGEFATLAGELTCPGIPLSWLCAEGQELKGSFDPDNRRFLLPKDHFASADFPQSFPLGAVTLGFVSEVERQRGVIRVHPGHTVTVRREQLSPNRRDRVDLLLAAGEVISIRLYRDDHGALAVRMDDIDDDEDVITPPDFGAGPWLVEGRDRVEEDDVIEEVEHDASLPIVVPQPEPVAEPIPTPRPGPGLVPAITLPSQDSSDSVTQNVPSPPSPKGALRESENQLHSARGERDRALLRLKALGGERAEELFATVQNERSYFEVQLARVQAELRAARSDLSDFRKRSRSERSAAPSLSGPNHRRSRFSTTEDWVREEARRVWISLYTPQERETFVLDDALWLIGPEFGESLTELKDSQLRRTFKLIVHLATGRNAAEGIVEVHPLRTADQRDAAPHIRADGAVCLRAYVEEGVPQSRRLHYWKVKDGLVELSRVVLHDDMAP
jgi:hypothetical protein